MEEELTSKSIELSTYVLLGNCYFLREGLPDEHPESVESKLKEAGL